MYAVVRDRGKQYTVREGETYRIDLLAGKSKDDTIEFNEVLLVSGDDQTTVGQPTVAGATVSAKVLGEVKDKKITVMRFRRRKDSQTKTGHRQRYTKIQIEKIVAGSQWPAFGYIAAEVELLGR